MFKEIPLPSINFMKTFLRALSKVVETNKTWDSELPAFERKLDTLSVKTIDGISPQEIRQVKTALYKLGRDAARMDECIQGILDQPSDYDGQDFI